MLMGQGDESFHRIHLHSITGGKKMKINALELENVKRIKAVRLEPSPNGLTIIGGKNGQGKTSVLDAIAWGLGGDRYKPSVPAREGALVPPAIHIELDNGIIVERKGKNSGSGACGARMASSCSRLWKIRFWTVSGSFIRSASSH